MTRLKVEKIAPTYKLTYFEARGPAEPIRYLLNYGNIDFEDIRLSKEEWPKYKDSTPYGKLPLFEKDGVKIPESVPICRYVANIVNLAGKDAWENLQIDSIVSAFDETRPKIIAARETKDPEEKKAKLNEFTQEYLPFLLSKFEAAVKKNNGYLVLGRLTWADLYVASLVPNLNKFTDSVDVLKNFPSLNALIKKVHAIPQIKKWIETRPVTEY